MAKKEFAVYHRVVRGVVNGRWADTTRLERVRVMARAEGYAMVRFPGAMPFVVSEKELTPDQQL